MGEAFRRALGCDSQSDSSEILSLLEKADNKRIRDYLKSQKLPFLDVGGNDPIARFLFDLKTWQTCLVAALGVVLGFLPGVVSYLEGTFFDSEAMKLCFSNDYGYFDKVLALFALLLLAPLYFSELPRTLLKLNISSTFNLDSKEWKVFVGQANKRFNKFLLLLIPYVSAILMTGILIYSYMLNKEGQWQGISISLKSRWAGFSTIGITLLLYYLLALVVMRVIVVYWILKDFFKYKPIIQPLHPDNCGGLSPLGKLSMKLNIGVFIFGIVFLIAVYVNVTVHHKPILHHLNIAAFVAYISVSSVMFFLPLFSAHNAMKNSKHKTIQKISDRYVSTVTHIIDSIENSGPLDKSETTELESLREIHEVASKMPVYPFNVATVTSYLSSIAVPVVVYVIQTLLSQHVLKG